MKKLQVASIFAYSYDYRGAHDRTAATSICDYGHIYSLDCLHYAFIVNIREDHSDVMTRYFSYPTISLISFKSHSFLTNPSKLDLLRLSGSKKLKCTFLECAYHVQYNDAIKHLETCYDTLTSICEQRIDAYKNKKTSPVLSRLLSHYAYLCNRTIVNDMPHGAIVNSDTTYTLV